MAQPPHADAVPAVSIQGLSKWYGSFQALRDIDLTIAKGEKIVIAGPSGSGKSTLIRCINHLETYQKGEIRVDGVQLTTEPRQIEAVRRDVGMVFQHFNLFPHMSVLENCIFAPMSVRGMSRPEAEELARHFLKRVRIGDQADKRPGQLSGGQQQRVAIARALCMRPRVMLFDEPTSALDPEAISEVLDTMVDLAGDGMTMICVTHEMGFARRVADRVVFMDKGEIIEIAPPAEFFTNARQARSRAFLQQVLSY